MNRWGKKALQFYLAGNASGCHMPNMRDSKYRPLQMICSVCCNQQGSHAAGRGLEMYRKPHKCFAVLYCLRQTMYHSTRSNTTNAPARPASWVKLK